MMWSQTNSLHALQAAFKVAGVDLRVGARLKYVQILT